MADWQKGDLALCVDGSRDQGAEGGAPPQFMIGGVYIVESIVLGGLGLCFADKVSSHPTGGWQAACFRKIPPLKPTADDREVIDLMNRKTVEA